MKPFDIDLNIGMTITEEYLIKIALSNNSESDIFLPSPGCYPISRLLVNEGEIPQQLTIRPSFHCAQNLKSIRSNETATYPFSYRLTDLFNLIEGEEYRIELIYSSNLKNSEGRIFKTDLRDTINYIMK